MEISYEKRLPGVTHNSLSPDRSTKVIGIFSLTVLCLFYTVSALQNRTDGMEGGDEY
jgi:hypothetical protein